MKKGEKINKIVAKRFCCEAPEVVTNFDRIKAMSVDELASFIAENSENGGFIMMADRYICRKCKRENGGRCPTPDDSDCMYSEDDTATIKRWLEGEVQE